MSQRGVPILADGASSVADRSLGNSVGAIGWPVTRTGGFGPGAALGWGRATVPRPFNHPVERSRRALFTRGCPVAPGAMIVTWLILPVVICLSQGLSHACLSISNLYRETANGSAHVGH